MNAAFVRAVLYTVFLLWALLLLVTTATRLHYTLTLKRTDPLNGGHQFYDPSVAELIFSAIIGVLFAPFMILSIATQYEAGFLSRLWFEVLSLGVLWFFWLGGSAAASGVWPAGLLASCAGFSQCRVLQAMLAFAWLGFLTITVMLLGTIFVAVRFNAWNEYNHGRWIYTGDDAYNSKNISGPREYNPNADISGPIGLATTSNAIPPGTENYIVYEGSDERYQQYQPAQPQPGQQQGGAVRLTSNYV